MEDIFTRLGFVQQRPFIQLLAERMFLKRAIYTRRRTVEKYPVTKPKQLNGQNPLRWPYIPFLVVRD